MEDYVINHRNVTAIMEKVISNGVVVIPEFFSKQIISSFDKELSSIWNNLALKDMLCMLSTEEDTLTKNSYKSGKVVRVSPPAYSNISNICRAFINNRLINEVIDAFYGVPNNKFMQIFAYYDTLMRDEEWVDGITHSAALHFDPYQSLKFVTYLSDTSEENGMTRIIPGSQEEGKYFRNNLKSSMWEGKEILDCHKPFEQSRYSEKDAIWPSVKAGTLVIFDTDCWHGGGEIKVPGLERKCIIVHSRKSS